jgi:hypothetical protein
MRASKRRKRKRIGPLKASGAFAYRMPCLHDVWGFFAFLKLISIKPDLVIATHSPYITLITGWLYACVYRKCLLWLDFRDPWAGNKKMPGIYPFSSIEVWLEKKAVARADIVTAASKGFANGIKKQTGLAHVDVISNTAAHWAKSATSISSSSDNSLIIAYTGTVETGWRDPSPLFELLACLRATSTPRECRITVASPKVGNLLQLAAEYKVSDCIDYRGSLEKVEALKLQHAADILLLLEDSATAELGVIPAKVFEYLLLDKPILMIGPTQESEIFKIVESAQRSLSLADLQSILTRKIAIPTMTALDTRSKSRCKVLAYAAALQKGS